jgi:2,3-bisphosphoglycerate-dependent phosphoglycerate mutase
MLYIVRHCKAAGQQPEAVLTADGHLQAVQLAERLAALPIERIISSPFLRAKQSIAPLAERFGLQINLDTRLAERVLAVPEPPDWLAALKLSFDDLDRCFTGVLVTHGNLLTLLLKHFDDQIGFAHWQQLTYPDVYRITRTAECAEMERIWVV